MASPSATQSKVPMTSLRKTALVAGLFYIITFVSIPTLWLYSPVKELGYIFGPGPDTRMIFGGVLEMIVGLAGIGTAVTLYPVLKRQNQGAALGFVGSRTLEAACIFAAFVATSSGPRGRTPRPCQYSLVISHVRGVHRALTCRASLKAQNRCALG